ncbi:hypothetical protein AVEN_39247-1 [Araneus ventricosus]|uniref:Uncharacterized protein n=1 Tax=Araneus ventricosus TaxID=182803 RepID=A0A4Y2EQF1_ARAVE|nr:hypothetical protein AVEN_39247-1 [Araneus ventricosus]
MYKNIFELLAEDAVEMTKLIEELKVTQEVRTPAPGPARTGRTAQDVDEQRARMLHEEDGHDADEHHGQSDLLLLLRVKSLLTCWHAALPQMEMLTARVRRG